MYTPVDRFSCILIAHILFYTFYILNFTILFMESTGRVASNVLYQPYTYIIKSQALLEIRNDEFFHIVFYTILMKQFGGPVYRFRTIHILYNSHYNIVVVAVSRFKCIHYCTHCTRAGYILISYIVMLFAQQIKTFLYILYIFRVILPGADVITSIKLNRLKIKRSIRAYIIVLYYFCSYACIFVRCIPFSFSV